MGLAATDTPKASPVKTLIHMAVEPRRIQHVLVSGFRKTIETDLRVQEAVFDLAEGRSKKPGEAARAEKDQVRTGFAWPGSNIAKRIVS
ncbi:hypothetical protein Tdes44962_MAKER07284 [Teratosphaeria destructans]|uniref:Uncharacterized protein n=1 Tax=Teratosphaeria destructans TaxID=418781 RepID=A0A9W7SZZ2_9PEZI|nr:hypothetical protein Tdes44962_MAKER07284 [Teratosphaeria destructans]